MSESQREQGNALKAAVFFKQAGLARLLAALREKYIEIGQVGGQIVLRDCTLQEKREIASFLTRPLSPGSTLKIRLIVFEQALEYSFHCSLLDLLNAFYPGERIVTRAELRSRHATHQEHFRASLASLTQALPQDSNGRAWLERGAHGQAWLYARYKNVASEEQQRQVTLARYIARIIDALPSPDRPERLALFAQRTSGDPHMLDSTRAAGRLFLLALSDLQQLHSGAIAIESGDNAPEMDVPPTTAAQQELRLYQAAGLLVDTISSNVAVFNLANAICSDGTVDPLPETAGKRVLLLPLRQLIAWQSAAPALDNIYVFENPQVFEEVIAGLDIHQARALPTLICSSGWPSVAAIRLFDLLLADAPTRHLHYSGDFDLKGLQIAAHLMARYPGRCHPWRFDPDAYRIALRTGGVEARANDLDTLQSLPGNFAPLIASMRQSRQWAYQEGIADVLLAGIQASILPR